MRTLTKLILTLAFVSPLMAQQTLPSGLTIVHATVVDTISGKLLRDQTVTVQGNRITGVAHSTKVDEKAAGTVVDAKGQYLIPGLWDMHTHVYFDSTVNDGSDIVLPLFVVNGVTGIRDMGSSLDLILAARARITAHQLLGPRMVVSGPMLDGPTSQYKAAIAITTPESGREAVDMLKSRGVDFIKVQSGVPHDAYFAIAEEARKVALPLEGHVPDAIRAREAIDAGQSTFEHLIGVFEASSPDEDKYLTGNKTPGQFLQTYDPAREHKIIQQIVEGRVWQCPTLYWERGQWLVDVIDFTKDPDLAYAPQSWVTKLWPHSQAAILKTLDTDPVVIRQRFVDHELDIVRKMHKAGVPFLAGTDTPAGVDVIPGISLHLELQRFVAAGFSNLEALRTATLYPAKFLGRLNDFGSVATGHIADLVLLEANPLESIAFTRRISGVVLDGRYYSSSELDGMRENLKKLAATR